MPNPESDAAVARGLEVVGKVYGPDVRDAAAGRLSNPQTRETIAHLMGEIWTRPQLSVRDRRMLILGLSATLSDADTIRIIITGAILNNELTEEELDEIPLFLSFYAGWGKAGALNRGIAEAREATADLRRERAQAAAAKDSGQHESGTSE
ncbi:carboxymuconolactone decarboxylase family protein [Sphingomonas sp. SRS2]|uniref:carboxymuconolactone decarboxylase family protein n=1 Tax=Sphingomonas sp. SRS2 TaxID=133190 RepID=UPI00061842BB|nr:carboxymuconolactone decarboxylase family protein [Sphingomonas sp. SRS2]KKC24565.1 hypothetical protein WP12_18530 [Sphingomonas sp. SRS2]